MLNKKNIFVIFTLWIASTSVVWAKPPVFTTTPEDALILSKEIDLDVLLIFTADWCVACGTLKNDLNTSSIIDDTIVCYIDFDKRRDMVKEFKVRIIPDCIVYRKNKEIKRKIGYKSKEDFQQWLKSKNEK